ncbi:TPA: hypothetical protein ACGOR8_002001 [Streptococcus suis]
MSKNKRRIRVLAKTLAKETYSELPNIENKLTLKDYERMHTLAFAISSDKGRFRELSIHLYNMLLTRFECGLTEEEELVFEQVLSVVGLVHRIILTLNKKSPRQKVAQQFIKTFSKKINQPFLLAKLYFRIYTTYEIIEY